MVKIGLIGEHIHAINDDWSIYSINEDVYVANNGQVLGPYIRMYEIEIPYELYACTHTIFSDMYVFETNGKQDTFDLYDEDKFYTSISLEELIQHILNGTHEDIERDSKSGNNNRAQSSYALGLSGLGTLNVQLDTLSLNRRFYIVSGCTFSFGRKRIHIAFNAIYSIYKQCWLYKSCYNEDVVIKVMEEYNGTALVLISSPELNITQILNLGIDKVPEEKTILRLDEFGILLSTKYMEYEHIGYGLVYLGQDIYYITYRKVINITKPLGITVDKLEDTYDLSTFESYELGFNDFIIYDNQTFKVYALDPLKRTISNIKDGDYFVKYG